MSWFNRKKEKDDGEHRQAAAPLYGHSPALASQGAGRPAFNASDTQSIYAAYCAGKLSFSETIDALDACYNSMTVPYAFAGGLGHGSTMAAAMAQHRAQLQIYKSMQGVGWMTAGGLSYTSSAPHEKTNLKPEGIRAGEIIAWRAWHVNGDKLKSVVAEGKDWSDTEPMQGDPAAGYGVHAYKGPHGPLLDSYVSKGSDKHWVIGEVALWGDVIEHEEGYRAEFARVHSLVTWHDSVTPERRKTISDKYLTSRAAFKLDDAA